jgi:hypothetical protein
MNNLQLTLAWVTDPKAAAREIEQRPSYWFPLLVVCLVTAGSVYLFYSWVDYAWFMDTTLHSATTTLGRSMTDAQIAQATQAVSPNTTKWLSVISSIVLVPIIRLLGALYYLLAGRITGISRSFRHWFSLNCWTGLPQVLSTLSGVLVLLTTTNRQVDAGIMSPLSLNELFFHLPIGARGYGLLTSINLLQIVSLYLVALTVRLWSGRSWLFSAAFTLFLPVLILGIGTWWALR